MSHTVSPPPAVAAARARVASLSYVDPGSARLEAARADLEVAKLAAHIARVVDADPALLSAEHIEKLRGLLPPASPDPLLPSPTGADWSDGGAS